MLTINTNEPLVIGGESVANLEEREHLAFFFPIQQIVVVLHGDEWGEVVRDRIAY